MCGYCYGGTIGISSGSPHTKRHSHTSLPALTTFYPHPVAPKHVVDVLVTLHPGNLKAEQFEAVDVPHCLIMAGEDMSFDSIRAPVLAILERKQQEGLPVANYVHEGTVHGSFARPYLKDEKIMKGFDEATKETWEWFKEQL